jgi:hypothetical protein
MSDNDLTSVYVDFVDCPSILLLVAIGLIAAPTIWLIYRRLRKA